MTTGAPILKSTLVAHYDRSSCAVLDELAPLHYSTRTAGADLPGHVRAASGLRRFGSRLVIVQDDVDALVVMGAKHDVASVLLPLRGGRRRFDSVAGNKAQKMDLEACVVLEPGVFVAFGSGAKSVREHLVVWDGVGEPRTRDAASFYSRLRSSLELGGVRLNIEGAAVLRERLLLFHRGNDQRATEQRQANAVIELDRLAFGRWVTGNADEPEIMSVTAVDLGVVGGVRFGFSDAVAVGNDKLVVLACAEDSSSALDDGAVLGCRVGLWNAARLHMVDVVDALGAPSRLKLEGIEPRAGSSHEFDIVVDVDSHDRPALHGRLTWRWQ